MDHPRDVLNNAREAYRSGNYPDALELYEWFFDHALDNDPASFYGVRLSYCLNEWSTLGEVYPKANERLKLRKEKSLKLLEETKKADLFHEYISICENLNCYEEVIPKFLEHHLKNQELAETIIRYIWHDLVVSKKWKVLDFYLKDSNEKYEQAIYKFDEAMNVCKSDPSLGGKDFEEQIKGWYIRGVSDLLLILHNNDRFSEEKLIKNQTNLDMEDRGYDDITQSIYKKISL